MTHRPGRASAPSAAPCTLDRSARGLGCAGVDSSFLKHAERVPRRAHA